MFLHSVCRLSAAFLFGAMLAPPAHAVTGAEKAWAMLEEAANSKSFTQRAVGVRALGMLHDDSHARELAEHALDDPGPEVRVAAARALGDMNAHESIPKLEKALQDHGRVHRRSASAFQAQGQRHDWRTGGGAVFATTRRAGKGRWRSSRSRRHAGVSGQRANSVLPWNCPTQAKSRLEWATRRGAGYGKLTTRNWELARS